MEKSFPHFYILYETIIDHDSRENVKRLYAFMKHTFLFVLLRSKSTPLEYAENTVPVFSTTYFKFHFRISKEMFEVILQHIGEELLPSHGGGSDETDPSKQVLLFLWYLANQHSMKEISHIFDLSMSTVHATLKRVNNAINGKLWNVNNICGTVEFMRGNSKTFVCNFRLYSGLIIMNRMKSQEKVQLRCGLLII